MLHFNQGAIVLQGGADLHSTWNGGDVNETVRIYGSAGLSNVYFSIADIHLFDLSLA